MVAIAVFFSDDIQVQSLLATLLVVLALCVHSLACPYINEALDGLELLSLFGSFCTYFFGQFLFLDTVSSLAKGIVSAIIVLVNFSVVLAVGFMVLGKGATAMKIFGRKFRALICCEKGRTVATPGHSRDDEKEPGMGSESDPLTEMKSPTGRKVKLDKKDRKGSKGMNLIQGQGQDGAVENVANQQPIGLYAHPQGHQLVPASPSSPAFGAQAPMSPQTFAYGQNPQQIQQQVMPQQFQQQVPQQYQQQFPQQGQQQFVQQQQQQFMQQQPRQIPQQVQQQAPQQMPQLVHLQSNVYGDPKPQDAQQQFAYVPKK